MKGIREMTLSKDTTPKEYLPPVRNYSLFDRDEDAHYNNANYNQSYDDLDTGYKKQIKGSIIINLGIDIEEIGPTADEGSPNYNWAKSINKATEIAYDKITELLGKNYESKYKVSFEVLEGYFEYEAIVTLIPNKLIK